MAHRPTDDELLAAAQGGDDDAFAALCARYEAGVRARLRRSLRGKLQRRVSASDVLQEVRMVAHRRLPEFRPEGAGAFGRWLDAIATRRVKHAQRFHLGAARRNAYAEITRPAMTNSPEPAAGERSASTVAISRELSDTVRAAIETLPLDQRNVLRLARRGDLTLQETADLLGKTRDAVKGLQSRALKRLAIVLGLEAGGS